MNQHARYGHEKLADWEKELLGIKRSPRSVLSGKISEAERALDRLYPEIGLATVEGRDTAALVTEAKVLTARVTALSEALDLL